MPIGPGIAAQCEVLALRLAQHAMAEVARHRPGPGERATKRHQADWVTVVDVDIERHVRQELHGAFPDHGLTGEELGRSGGAEGAPRWYIDPIDGTTNFVHGVPWSSFTMALADETGLVVGVVADPYRGEVFSAVRGQGARLNGETMLCPASGGPAGAGLTGGVVLSEQAGVECWPGMLSMVAALSARKCVTRIMGSSALSLATVAAGRASGAVLGGFDPIDVGAGVLIARESGAEVRTGPSADIVLGGRRDLSRAVLIAAPVSICDELAPLVEGLPPDR
jgi:myo-inositol-1(or 4)-monophosphatase